MPLNKKLTLIRHKASSNGNIFPCEICGYLAKSEIAMRLHRKTRHEITEKYEHPFVVFLCRGCRKEKKDCKCKRY